MLWKLQAHQDKLDDDHTPGWGSPQVGDLVMVRRHALDNQKERSWNPDGTAQ